MTNLFSSSVVRQIGSLFEGGSVAGLADRQLLERFVAQKDAAGEAAFAALVSRHGPMVLDVCIQILGDLHHAEDAFQAVFLVLARRARSIRDPDLLGNWLYGVAIRTARCARQRIARQRRREEGGTMRRSAFGSCELAERTAPPADRPAIDHELAEAIHDEIDRLPRAFRLPVVLCYFDGLTLDEAARRLRWPEGTIRSRLARSREKLKIRLACRGVALPAAALAAVLAPRSASASLPPLLCQSTTQAAIRFAAGQAAPPFVVSLAGEVLRSMFVKKLTLIATTLLLLAAVASGAGYLTHSLARQDEAKRQPDALLPQAAARPDDTTQRPAPGRMFVAGRVLDSTGKPIPSATVMAYAAIKQPGRGDAYDQRTPSAIGHSRSDGSGRFRVDASRTTSARHYLAGAVALAPGFGAGWAEIDPDADTPTTDIVLRTEQIVEGRLFDLNGQPVGGVAVSVVAMGRVVPLHLGTASVRESLEGPFFSSFHPNDMPAWPRPAISDAVGRFTVRGIGQDIRARLLIDDPRFARQRVSIDTGGTSRSKSVHVALEPARIIAGHVTDADTGQPIPHARLVVLSHKESAGTVNFFEADDQGRFRMNPLSADRYSLTASATSGPPYLIASIRPFAWPKGAIEHRIDLALHRGVVIRGKVVEEDTGQPVAGARVNFGARRTTDEATDEANGATETASDGSFQLAARPAPGYLIVLGPNDDYVYQAIGQRMVRQGEPGGRRYYAHAFIPHEPKQGVAGSEVRVPLRRGMTVKGRAVGPDDSPIPTAAMISRVFLQPSPSAWLFWQYNYVGQVRDGRFEIHGLDPLAEVPIHFLESKSKLGATAQFSGKSASGGPVTVRLEPCGTAKARLIDRDGKPVAGFRGASLIAIVVTPGASLGVPDQRGQLAADQAGLVGVDPINYAPGPSSDAEGWIVLPALIPGATYSIRTPSRSARSSFRRDITVKPDETLNLGDILVEKPRPQ